MSPNILIGDENYLAYAAEELCYAFAKYFKNETII